MSIISHVNISQPSSNIYVSVFATENCIHLVTKLKVLRVGIFSGLALIILNIILTVG